MGTLWGPLKGPGAIIQKNSATLEDVKQALLNHFNRKGNTLTRVSNEKKVSVGAINQLAKYLHSQESPQLAVAKKYMDHGALKGHEREY